MWESGRALSEQAAMKEGDEAKEPGGRREIKYRRGRKIRRSWRGREEIMEDVGNAEDKGNA